MSGYTNTIAISFATRKKKDFDKIVCLKKTKVQDFLINYVGQKFGQLLFTPKKMIMGFGINDYYSNSNNPIEYVSMDHLNLSINDLFININSPEIIIFLEEVGSSDTEKKLPEDCKTFLESKDEKSKTLVFTTAVKLVTMQDIDIFFLN